MSTPISLLPGAPGRARQRRRGQEAAVRSELAPLLLATARCLDFPPASCCMPHSVCPAPPPHHPTTTPPPPSSYICQPSSLATLRMVQLQRPHLCSAGPAAAVRPRSSGCATRPPSAPSRPAPRLSIGGTRHPPENPASLLCINGRIKAERRAGWQSAAVGCPRPSASRRSGPARSHAERLVEETWVCLGPLGPSILAALGFAPLAAGLEPTVVEAWVSVPLGARESGAAGERIK